MAVGHWTQRRPREVQKESSKGSHQAGRPGPGSSAGLPDPQGSSAARAAAFPAGPSCCAQMPLFMPSLPEEPPGASLCSSQLPAPSRAPAQRRPWDSTATLSGISRPREHPLSINPHTRSPGRHCCQSRSQKKETQEGKGWPTSKSQSSLVAPQLEGEKAPPHPLCS